ncbi:MAG: PHP domain-containing protein, partial [Candidatus Omnitrophota bacterium]
MLLELHSHTSRYSKCSVCTPEDLVRRIMEKGLQGLVITEHHYLWTDDEIRQLKRDAGVGEHFLIMAGQEVDTDIGHVVVYGAKETIPERIKLTELREKFPDAALLWAHPFRKGRLPEIRQLLDENINAVEIISSNHTVQESCL